MAGILLPLHLLAAGVWLGCVLVEAAFERALAEPSDYRLVLTNLHDKVDKIVEIPAFSIVLLTGIVMLGTLLTNGVVISGLLLMKIAIGIMTVLINIYCASLVFERNRLAIDGDDAGFKLVDDKQHKWGALVLIGIVMATMFGLVLALSL